MLKNAFLFFCSTYAIVMVNLLWTTFIPPTCRTSDHCIAPLFDQTDLASADLYFLVTDDPALGKYRANNDRPPAHIAQAAWAVVEAFTKYQRAQKTANSKVSEACTEFSEDPVCHSAESEVIEANDGDAAAADLKSAAAVTTEPPVSMKLAWHATGLDLSNNAITGSRNFEQQLRVPVFTSSRRNATLYGLFFLCPGGRPLNPVDYPIELPAVVNGLFVGGGRQRTFEESVLFTAVDLTAHYPRRSFSSASLLLERPPGEESVGAPSEALLQHPPSTPPPGLGSDGPEVSKVVSHWRFSSHPLRLRLVDLGSAFLPSGGPLPPDNLRLLVHRANSHFFGTRKHGKEGDVVVEGQLQQYSPPTSPQGVLTYRPYFYVDTWTIMQRQMKELSSNLSFPDPPALLQVKRASLGRSRTFTQVELAFNTLLSTGLVGDGDLDEIKRYLSDEYLWRFALMQAISMAHAVLSFLAFKNDVGFWKGRESVAGLSSRSVVFHAFASTVIFLYLADFSTSLIVLATSGVGAVIDCWKVSKVLKFSWSWSNPWSSASFGARSAAEARTAELDATALDALALGVGPLVVGFAAYSLIYYPHKSWYSWAVESLANAIYMFGFVFMTPQLFINYRLKSVAHMPWRVMGYKFFNTVIDDVFSFVVDMPLSHRIACFRDDAVFLVFLWQLWAYRVDKTRANEFGMAYEEEDNVKDDGNGVHELAAAALTSPSGGDEAVSLHSARANEKQDDEETSAATGEPRDGPMSSCNSPEPRSETRDGASCVEGGGSPTASNAHSEEAREEESVCSVQAKDGGVTQQMEDELSDFAAWM